MGSTRILAIVLIVLGALALLYSSFSFTRDGRQTQVGPLVLTVRDRQTINVPIWAGAAAVIAGGAILLGARRRI
jgi:hypothetical protein